MAFAPNQPVIKHRFHLELWLEPREVATRIRRLRGRILDVRTRRTHSVGGLADVDAFIKESVAALEDVEVDWETGT
ncbi:hypothetical protein [Nocardioides sp.]|uniref:hypothetical protein n=1 Tax=Nocardioides sp. TaxID=35761 RepID=UPI00261D6288|nr:hypothetical protein [Nocardioides sp.]MDI6911063.1 hypothetical protein [Nocardioides sp.]